MRPFLNITASLGLILLFSGCASEPPSSTSSTTATTNAAASTGAASNPATPANGPVDPSKPVTLAIESPQTGEIVTATDVPVKFKLENYVVEPGGQHIHVILDNEPYQPAYTVAEPFALKDVKPGVHTIRAFPSRAWHESIKDPTAFASVTFYVEKKVGTPPVNFSTDPLLTYSRPKGKYEGEKANKILFDFWVKNAEIGEKFKVRYKLDNEKPQTLDEWKPSFFENLPTGKHKLVVDLVDKKGSLVKGKYNHTEREFEVAK